MPPVGPAAMVAWPCSALGADPLENSNFALHPKAGSTLSHAREHHQASRPRSGSLFSSDELEGPGCPEVTLWALGYEVMKPSKTVLLPHPYSHTTSPRPCLHPTQYSKQLLRNRTAPRTGHSSTVGSGRQEPKTPSPSPIHSRARICPKSVAG